MDLSVWTYRVPRSTLKLNEVDSYSRDWPSFPYYYSVSALDGFKRLEEKSEWPAGTSPPNGPVPIPPERRQISAQHIQDPTKADLPPVALTVIIDTSRVDQDRPEVRLWAQHAAEVCEAWYPIICHATVPLGINPPHKVTLFFVPHSIVPAFCDGKGAIIFDTPNILRDPTNYGMVVHELTHLPQQTKTDRLAWLAEGIADYTRCYLYEIDSTHGMLRPGVSRYTDSYRTTAAFLDYLVKTYDPAIVLKFSSALRHRSSSNETIDQMVANDATVPPKRRKNLDRLFSDFMTASTEKVTGPTSH